MANHRGVKLFKARGQYTENKTANVRIHITDCIDTKSRTFRFFLTSLSISIFIAMTPILFICWTCSFTFAWRARQATVIVKMTPAFPLIRYVTHGKSWKIIKLFQKLVNRIAKTSSIGHIFVQSFCSSRRHFTWGKSFSMLIITDLNTTSPVEGSLTVTVLHITSASLMRECWQNLPKLTNQTRGYVCSGIPRKTFC